MTGSTYVLRLSVLLGAFLLSLVPGARADVTDPAITTGRELFYQGVDGDKRAVREATGLSCSVGISDNKQRAKVATGFAKPPNGAGVRVLTDADWMDTVGQLPVDTLWGVGPKTTKRLAALDITTVRALAHADAETVVATFVSYLRLKLSHFKFLLV